MANIHIHESKPRDYKAMTTTNKFTLKKAQEDIAKETNYPSALVEQILSLYFQKVGKSLCDGNDVIIQRIGSFRIRKTKSRNFFNVTEQKNQISTPKNKAVFVPSRHLLEEINRVID